ncbi:hypothetical protein [Nocardiopsis halotolerans]|uniref:hypothetical protein n=1 Tax=Nocardiopsis halotolerans TaxID=124252 RepID=UPI0003469D6E|nr:hypothetical protein [Nocardiopsis halotolerans]
MRISLPIEVPLASGYQFYAFPLAILATVEDATDWVLSNHIHVVYDPRKQRAPVPFAFYFFDYSRSPWLETVKTDRFWMAATGQDAVSVCRDAIAAGYYPYLNLNEFRVPGRDATGKRDQSHDVLLCGFDDGAGVFELLGYSDTGTLDRSHIGYRDFAAGYADLDAIPNGCHQVFFYRVSRDCDYTMNPSLVGEALEEYLRGDNASLRFGSLQTPWNRVYGIRSYDLLSEYVTDYVSGAERYDIRNLHVLWEHKHLMTLRLERLTELTGKDCLSGLATTFREVEADALALRNGMLKYELSGRSSRFADTWKARLERVRERETEILRSAVEALRPT